HRTHVAFMREGMPEPLARGCVPQLRRIVPASRQHSLAIRAEGHGTNVILVDQGWFKPLVLFKRLTRCRIPQLCCAIPAPRQHGPAVRAKDHGTNRSLMLLQTWSHWFASRRTPLLRCPSLAAHQLRRSVLSDGQGTDILVVCQPQCVYPGRGYHPQARVK